MIRWLKRVDRTAREVYAMFRHEMANPSMIGPHSPRLWRRGFYSVSHYIYDLARNPVDDYVPDRVRARYGTRINGSFCDLTRNKLAFQLLFEDQFREYFPRIFGTVLKGRFLPWGSPSTFRDTLLSQDKVILKPVGGSGGLGVYVLRSNGNGIVLNDRVVSTEDVESLLSKLDGYIVTEFIDQASYASEIFPDSTNTVRVLTMWDSCHEPFIAVAVHRFGTKNTAPVDNWCRGGLSSLIDLASGTLGAGVTYPTTRTLSWYQDHPDTGKPIAGTTVPNWDIISSQIIRMARSVDFLPYIGWDVVATADGFAVLEGNSNSDVDLLQTHTPLLAGSRVRTFYKTHGMKGIK